MNAEIQTGGLRGKTLVVEEGQTVSVGRTEKADFPLPQDTFLSRVHFALECGVAGCRVVDRQSANGTYLNGQKVSEAEVKDGDIIRAGQTEFLLRLMAVPAAESVTPAAGSITESAPKEAIIPAAEGLNLAQQAAAVRTESWSFGVIPEGWRVVEGFGLRRDERNAFPSEAMASQEIISQQQTLSEYAESQFDTLRLLISQPQIEPLDAPPVAGAEEVCAFAVRYKAEDGRRFVQRQVFVRRGRAAGSLALTTLESELPAVQPVFEQILLGAAFGADSGK
ncbi:MAG TPA: FHA domain-containing protein [Terriglobia bacterium]|nr:FHA domain-containing protein [Terriglobia bacterium]